MSEVRTKLKKLNKSLLNPVTRINESAVAFCLNFSRIRDIFVFFTFVKQMVYFTSKPQTLELIQGHTCPWVYK